MQKISLSKKNVLHFLGSNTGIGLIVIAVMLLIGFTFNHKFLSTASIANILTGTSILAIASLGQLLCIIMGGVDLSIAACISLGAVVSAVLMNGSNQNIGKACLVLLASGILIGCMNSIGIIYARIPPLIMTLSIANVINVVQLIACNGSPTGSPAPLIRFIGKEKALPVISMITLLLILITVMIYFLFKHNGYPKQLYAIGNNKNAAILAGINVKRVQFLTYIISAVLGCFTGMLLLGYINFPYINMGERYGMETVAAVIIGGASFAGGRGNFMRTIIGALVLVILSNVLIAIQLNDSVKNVINGLALLVILVFYTRESAIRQ